MRKHKTAEIYGIPNCTTVQKAMKYLDENGIRIEMFHNIKEVKLSRSKVEELASLVGGAEELFSKRAMKYRELKLNERNLSSQEMIDLMADEFTFVKRPVLVSGTFAIAGFTEKRYQDFVKGKR